MFLAEFLKEKPYNTDIRDIGYEPWLLMPERLKDERIGQSVITAEIGVLSQYFTAAIGRYMDDLVPHVPTLGGWAEILFGVVDPHWKTFFELAGVLFAVVAIIGFLLLQRSEKLVFGSILLPVLGIASYLATRVPLPAYPIAKLIFSFSPFVCVLVFSAISRLTLSKVSHLSNLPRISLSVLLVAAAARGSIKEYRVVANKSEFLERLRDPGFLDVCRKLESLRDGKVLICDSDPFRLAWFCYHARKNDVYCSATQIGNASIIGQSLPFLDIPRMESIDFVVSRDGIVNTRGAPLVPKIVNTKSAGSSGD